MPKSVSYETVGVSYDTVGVSYETVGTIMKQGDYSEKSHKKCPEEHRACGRLEAGWVVVLYLTKRVVFCVAWSFRSIAP